MTESQRMQEEFYNKIGSETRQDAITDMDSSEARNLDGGMNF